MIEIKAGMGKNLMVFMAAAADHVTGATGLSLSIEASKDGGAFAAIALTVTERGYGWYLVELASSHCDTIGDLCLHISASGADPTDLKLQVVANIESDTYTQVGTRLAAASYTAPDNAGVAAVKAKTDNLPADPASNTQVATRPTLAEIEASSVLAKEATVGTRLAAASYTAPDNAGIAAVQVVAGQLSGMMELDGGIYRYTENALEMAPAGEGGGTGPTVEEIWTYADRSLTSPPVVIPVLQGNIATTTVLEDNVAIRIMRGDTPRITFDLGADYSGWEVWFGAKNNPADEGYVIIPRQAAWLDAANGQGYVDLTADDTANYGRYRAEIELRNGASRLTPLRCLLHILPDIIRDEKPL